MTPIFSSQGTTFRTFVFYVCVFFGIVVFIGYILFQARFMLEGPKVTLLDSNSTVFADRVVTLEGSARNIVRMSLNGRQIYTDASGNFKEALVLENGYTIATLRAEDRYGRITDITRGFVYRDDTTVVTNQ